MLKKVIEWCEQHKSDPPAAADDDSDSRKKTTDIDEWDQKFMQVDQEMLFEIILVRSSPDFVCAALALISSLFHRPQTTSISRHSSMLDVRPSPT